MMCRPMYKYSTNYTDVTYLEKNVALFVVSLVGSCFYFITSMILLTSVYKGRSNGAIPWLIMSLYVIIACVIVFKFLIIVGIYLFALPFLVQSSKLYFNHQCFENEIINSFWKWRSSLVWFLGCLQLVARDEITGFKRWCSQSYWSWNYLNVTINKKNSTKWSKLFLTENFCCNIGKELI